MISNIWPEKYDCLMAPNKQYAFFQLLFHVLIYLDVFFSDPSVFHFCIQSMIITITMCKKRNRWKIWFEIKTSQ